MNNNNYLAAQRSYDRQEPPEYNTNEEGECDHEWVVVKSIDTGEERLNEYKCKLCGAKDHD